MVRAALRAMEREEQEHEAKLAAFGVPLTREIYRKIAGGIFVSRILHARMLPERHEI